MRRTRGKLHPCFFLILAAALAGCGDAHKTAADDASHAPAAAVVKVARGNIADNLEIASEFQPFQEVDVYAKVSGYIQKLYVDYGTHVKQGQILAVLEIPELQQQLQQDQAAIRRSEQELQRAREDLNRAQSAYTVAHLTYSRMADVQKSRPELIAQQEIDMAKGKDLEADAEVSAQKAAIAGAEQALLVAKSALGKDQAMFDYARMTAPFDGVITQIYARTGALLPAGTSSSKNDAALCRLSQNSLLRLVIPVPERAVPDVHAGESVVVNVSGLNKTIQGKIVRFSDQIDTATRTMHTEVDVANSRGELVPGMYASVKIPLHSAANVLMVPIQAVQAAGEGKGIVLVVDRNNKIEKRAVTVGLQSGANDEITSGLQENETIVFGSQGAYQPGELVSPKLVEPSAAD
ncbi:MAG TPA: efflux RND transporter periplasmic adaptor subunit [Candidatus Acidoferrales bacterium]|nr:efflux RND transporter periplasmic adaptor subunit [Candidatus Acidoferrales bacterium]